MLSGLALLVADLHSTELALLGRVSSLCEALVLLGLLGLLAGNNATPLVVLETALGQTTARVVSRSVHN